MAYRVTSDRSKQSWLPRRKERVNRGRALRPRLEALEDRRLLAAEDVALLVYPHTGEALLNFKVTQTTSGYQIDSAAGQLVPANWITLNSQGYTQFETFGTPSSASISEGSLGGTLTYTGTISLGDIFTPDGTRDLAFLWIDATGDNAYYPDVEYVGATTTALSSSLNPAAVGQAVDLTATVTSVYDSGVPTGNVTFWDGATSLGTVALNGSGQATLSTSSLSIGTHTITAVYAGDSTYDTSTSSGLSQVVDPVTTSTTLSSTLNPAVVGQSVGLVATVTASDSSTPTGSVTFKEGATELGTVALNGSGQATLSLSTLSVGSHSIVAYYNGDTGYGTSNSTPLSQTVNQASTSTALDTSGTPVLEGALVTFTATVTTSNGPGTPSGTVTFMDGATSLATEALNGSGVATYSTSTLTPGTHSITAVYNGATDYAGSTSSPLSQVIEVLPPASDVTLTVYVATGDVELTFHATQSIAGYQITSAGSQLIPANWSTLASQGYTGFSTLSSTSADLSEGNLSGYLTHAVGTIDLGNVFTVGGTEDLAFSWLYKDGTVSFPSTVDYVYIGTTTGLSSTLNPAVVGQSVGLVATVTAADSSTPTGTVTFKEGATVLGSAALNGSGQATLTLSTLSVGSHSIVAYYGGAAGYNTSNSTPLSQTVNQATTATALSTSQTPKLEGTPVTFTATVTTSDGPGVPPGTVTFKDGATTLDTVALDGGGVATYTTSSLSVGTHSITAVYNGATDYAGSTSSPLSQVIEAIPPASDVTLTVNVGTGAVEISFNVTQSIAGYQITSASNQLLPANWATLYSQGYTDWGTLSSTSGDLSEGALSGYLTHSAGTISLGNVFTALGTEDLAFSWLYKDGTISFPSTVDYVRTDTTTALSSTVNPSAYGQSVSLVATVTAADSSTPTGSVTFKEGATVLGTAALDGSGQATLTLSTLSVGSHSIVASYGGAPGYNASDSSPLGQTVSQDTTATALASTLNPSGYGQSVSLVATVTATHGTTPTGSVTFKEGATVLGTAALNGSGVATLALSTLDAGSHSIVAYYGGSANHAASDSTALNQTVNQAATTTTLSTSQSPEFEGTEVTFTATVTTGAPGTPGGTVTFKDGATTLGTVALSGGTATLATSTLSVGTHSITAEYNGATNYAPSTSNTVSQVIERMPLASDVTLTVSMATGSAKLTFNVEQGIAGYQITSAANQLIPANWATLYSQGYTDWGTLSSTSGDLSEGVLSGYLTHGVGTIDLGNVFTPGGTQDLAFNWLYKNGFFFFPSTVEYVFIETTTALSSSLNPSVYGQSVSLTATVTAADSSTPVGSVTFREGATVLGTVALDGSAQATLTLSTLDAGSHSITAYYSGGSGYNASNSTALSQTVNQATTATTLSTSETPSLEGAEVTFSAHVTTSDGPGVPPGTVTFKDGAATLATVALDGSGWANFATSLLAAGTHSITAVYNGDTNYAGSTSDAVSQSVVAPPPATDVTLWVHVPTGITRLSFNATQSIAGYQITSAGNQLIPGNWATLYSQGYTDWSTLMSTSGDLSEGDLVGSLTHGPGTIDLGNVFTPSGTQDLVFSWLFPVGGLTQYPSVQYVTTTSTTTALSSSVNPSNYSQSVTFTATVTPGIGTQVPTGSVTFWDGATSLGTAALDGSGQATLSLSTLSVGDHSITAEYLGNAPFTASTSAPLTQTVQQITTTTALASSVNPSYNSQSVTFTATVTAASGTASGNVTFYDGATSLGTAALNGSGQATLAVSSLSVGSHSITAAYEGNPPYTPSTSAPLTQTVQQVTTTTALASSVNPSYYLQSTTLTATVTASFGTPTGTVTFKDGATTLGTAALNGSGQATLAVSSLSVGTHALTAVYAGDGVAQGSTSSAVSQVVNVNTVSTFDVQRGLVNRSYVRYIDLYFANQAGVADLITSGRVKLTKHDFSGNNPQNVSLAGFLSSSANRLIFDFGSTGLGGLPNSLTPDGYYKVTLDLDGNGTFETEKRFIRMLGDISGNKAVNLQDFGLLKIYYGTSDARGDFNGNGTVNLQDFGLLKIGYGHSCGLPVDD